MSWENLAGALEGFGSREANVRGTDGGNKGHSSGFGGERGNLVTAACWHVSMVETSLR